MVAGATGRKRLIAKPVASPTSRSLKYLRDNGYTCQTVEKFIVWTKRRLDLFGCIDIVAIKEGVTGVLGVQATTDTGGQMSKHYKKAIKIPELKIWLLAGNRFILQCWALKGKAGKRKTYQLREKEILLSEL